MPKFYVHHEVETFKHDYQEVEAMDEVEAAKIEASRAFDEDGVDPLRPVEVIVARTRNGDGAMRFEVRRTVIIEHDIVSEQEISIENYDEVGHDDED